MQKLSKIIKSKLLFAVALIFLFLLFFGCNPRGFLYPGKTEIHNTSKPILFNGNSSGTIAVANIKLEKSLWDKPIGKVYEGLIPYKTMTFYGADAKNSEHVCRTCIENQLLETNYPIFESTDSVFEMDLNNLKKPDLLVGGTITGLKYDVFSTNIHGRKSEAKVRVKWQLLDNKKGKIIYEKITIGAATGPFSIEVGNVTIAAAVCGSFREILADRNFIETVNNHL